MAFTAVKGTAENMRTPANSCHDALVQGENEILRFEWRSRGVGERALVKSVKREVEEEEFNGPAAAARRGRAMKISSPIAVILA